ncbi:MAG: xanthine dehydrogenase family protein molybdopterin-binding subunit [Candidatus Tectomicrobia bacterium]|nr:xanthine dehydrogenase family protein molybdopterin-binding subunit [Candidatus Tectomicrobia bacterium]
MTQAEEGWIGKRVARFEDGRLLRGRGQFMDDLLVAGLHHAALVRSPHPHATILRIDTRAAERLPGVVGVLTGADVKAMSRPFPIGTTTRVDYFCCAIDRVRYVGEPVAVVVARDRYVAEDAADLVVVEYEPLPAAVDPEEAMTAGAPQLHEHAARNIAVQRTMRFGDPEAAFREADLTVSARLHFPRYSSIPLETYAVIADYEPGDGVVTIKANFQGPFLLHSVMARALRLPENKLRVIVPGNVGGGFGIKVSMYPYMTLMALAARKMGCPVKWVEDRREHLIGSSSHTDRVTDVEAAVKNDGAILGLRINFFDNVGAYIRAPEPGCLFRTAGCWVGSYRIQHIDLTCSAVMTNRLPTGPNRGWGGQQWYFTLERLMDRIARRLDMDPTELRRRNFLQPDQFPYRTPTGGLYDSGDYPAGLERLLDMCRYEKLRAEQRQARAQGRYLGIGLATVTDPTTTNLAWGSLVRTPEERAQSTYLAKTGTSATGIVKVDPLGKVTAVVNTAAQGQGHETIVAQIIGHELTIPPQEITVTTALDTFLHPWSVTTGTYASRFASTGASAFAMAARTIRKKMIDIAAHLLEARTDDIELRNGRFQVRGDAQRVLDFAHVAGTAHWSPQLLPAGMEMGLQCTHLFNISVAEAPDAGDRVNSCSTYGFIAELAVVEVDITTGEVELRDFYSVHDAGVILNPLIIEGQLLGAIVHGIGGALYEEMSYDADGQMTAATFSDYLCPGVMDLPPITMAHMESPSPFTVLGTKGCGEGSAISVPPAVANAVEDALAPLGVSITHIPLHPSRVWKLLKATAAATA